MSVKGLFTGNVLEENKDLKFHEFEFDGDYQCEVCGEFTDIVLNSCPHSLGFKSLFKRDTNVYYKKCRYAGNHNQCIQCWELALADMKKNYRKEND